MSSNFDDQLAFSENVQFDVNIVTRKFQDNDKIDYFDKILCSQQLSQFWYDDDTAVKLSEEVCYQIPHSGKIALIGCPSLYYFIKKKVGDSAVGNEILRRLQT